MTDYCVRLGITVTRTAIDDVDLDTFTDLFMDELLDLNATGELVGSLTDGVFQVWLTVAAATLEQAVVDASTTIRTAAHAAGGHTPAWPDAPQWPKWIHTDSVEAHVVEDADRLVSA